MLGLLILLVGDGGVTSTFSPWRGRRPRPDIASFATKFRGWPQRFGNLFESALFIQGFDEFVEVVPRSGALTASATPYDVEGSAFSPSIISRLRIRAGPSRPFPMST